MLGDITFKLRAENNAPLPPINGRLMHAAFFRMINDASPELGFVLHERTNLKPFTVSFLEPLGRKNFRRRITTLNEELFRIAVSVPLGYPIQVGALRLSVADVLVEEAVSKEEFVAAAKHFPPIKEIKLNFRSPTTFRVDDHDAPYPRAELIFSSLVDKWTQAGMPAAADRKLIREFASQLRLSQWSGQSQTFFLASDRGTTAFWGEFRFALEQLSEDVRRVFALLSLFAEYSGVGRLTAQGFGQTRVEFA